jgi:hypothetical protein
MHEGRPFWGLIFLGGYGVAMALSSLMMKSWSRDFLGNKYLLLLSPELSICMGCIILEVIKLIFEKLHL